MLHCNNSLWNNPKRIQSWHLEQLYWSWAYMCIFRSSSNFTHFSPSLKECCELDIEYIMAVWCWEAACNKHWTHFFLSQKEISLCDQEMVWKCRLWDSLLHSLMYILMAHWRDDKPWHLSCQSCTWCFVNAISGVSLIDWLKHSNGQGWKCAS